MEKKKSGKTTDVNVWICMWKAMEIKCKSNMNVEGEKLWIVENDLFANWGDDKMKKQKKKWKYYSEK